MIDDETAIAINLKEMKMKKNILFFLLSLALVSTVHSQPITVFGKWDCGQWLTARKQMQSQYMEQYLIGQINGMSLGSLIDIWMVKGNTVSDKQLFFWMDSFCQNNPLSNLMRGATSFADERTDGAFSKRLEK